MKKLQAAFISIALILTITLAGCGGECKNCNIDGTPFPTLEAEAWPTE